MSAVSFFDLRARNKRHDELVESAIQDIRALWPLLTTDTDMQQAVMAVEAIKKLRRPETVAAMEQARLRRITGETNAV